ncbi:MAG TPA: hypothetical protein VFG52_03620 [Xanthomonadales bacterium]|nr:hypothetical protein [Xanthomonadales bacterium]
MNINDDLLGKTITGVIAHRSKDTAIREIWVLQFDDGSHIEFVSPKGLRALRRAANQPGNKPGSKMARNTKQGTVNAAIKLADSRAMRYQREVESG